MWSSRGAPGSQQHGGDFLRELKSKTPIQSCGCGKGWRGKIQLKGGEIFPAKWLTVFSRNQSRNPRWVYD